MNRNKIPNWIKNSYFLGLRAIPIQIRLGKKFRNTLKFLQKSEWWSKDEIESYQLEQLTRLIKHSYKNVPYYTNLFDNEGLKPSDIDDFDKLRLIPPLTKEIIQNNLEKLKAKNYPENKFEKVTTGGSTGTPMPFYFEVGISLPMEFAFHWRYRNILGIHFRDEYVCFGGRVFNKIDKNGNIIWWKYDISNRILFLSSYHMKDEILKLFVKKIKSKKRIVLAGYPSSLDILATYMKKNNLFFNNIKVVHTNSENLYLFQKNIMKSQFGANVFDHYGNSERCVLMHQCEYSDLYHIIPEYGFTEILDNNGKKINISGKKGEIYATGFMNYAFPFIRFKTDDIVEFSGKNCPCGRNFQTVKSIEGRLHEFIITKEKRKVSMTGINPHSTEFDNIKQLQFFQEEIGVIVLKVIRNNKYSEIDNEKIKNYIGEKTNFDVEIVIEFVYNIPRTKSGKFKWLDQKLKF